MNIFFKLKTVVNQFYLKKHFIVLGFELCSSFLFMRRRGRYVWFSQWPEFSLGKAFIVAEVDSPSSLVLTGVSLVSIVIFLGLKVDAVRHSCPGHSGFCLSFHSPVCLSVLNSTLLSFYSFPLITILILTLCRYMLLSPSSGPGAVPP